MLPFGVAYLSSSDDEPLFPVYSSSFDSSSDSHDSMTEEMVPTTGALTASQCCLTHSQPK